MNPYTSLWTGVTAGDGPQEFHVVLLDNGRTRVLARRRRPAGAALHPLQRVPERLPGVLAHRRARVRLRLSGPDRRDPHAAAHRDRERVRRCRSRRPCAAPATRSARSRSTSRRCCCTCAEGGRARRRRGAERAAMRAAAWAFAGRRRFALAQRLGRLAQRPSCAAGRIAPAPGPLAGVDAVPRPEAARARELPRVVAAAVSDARDEILARVAPRSRGAARRAGRARVPPGRQATRERAGRALLRARRRVPRRGPPGRPTRSRRRVAASAARGPARRSRRASRRSGGPPASSSSSTTALSPRELDALDGVLTGCTVAIAETGHDRAHRGPARGPPRAHARPRPARLRRRGARRRARARGVRALASAASRPITFVSGPSATSDIELEPRRGRPRAADARRARDARRDRLTGDRASGAGA